jgi:terminase large subunit-like protein
VTTLTHRFVPRGAAVELFTCRAPEVLVSGPAGTGKSRACLEKLSTTALANPGMRGLIVRKVRDTLGGTALVTWREHVVVEALAHGTVAFYGGSAAEPAQYRYSNGSVIVIGGMDKPSKIMSSEYDMVYVQEATELTLTDWEALTTRLRYGRVPFQQLIADCNPDAPTHWLKRRCDDGATVMLHSRHEDNPVLFRGMQPTELGAAYIAKLDALTGVRKLRLRLGLWAAAEGVIYAEWSDAVHLVDRFVPPDDWPRYWSVDFGYTNPFVCQRWAVDPDGRLYLYGEHYRTQRTVDQHAVDILATVAPRGSWIEPRPKAIVADHDAEGRAQLVRRIGQPTAAARKDVVDGIQAVQRRLRLVGDGRPRLHIMRGALAERDPALHEARLPTSTVEELPGYVWAVTPNRPPKEEPVKANDHGMDATRYMVAHLDLGARPGVRFL